MPGGSSYALGAVPNNNPMSAFIPAPDLTALAGGANPNGSGSAYMTTDENGKPVYSGGGDLATLYSPEELRAQAISSLSKMKYADRVAEINAQYSRPYDGPTVAEATAGTDLSIRANKRDKSKHAKANTSNTKDINSITGRALDAAAAAKKAQVTANAKRTAAVNTKVATTKTETAQSYNKTNADIDAAASSIGMPAQTASKALLLQQADDQAKRMEIFNDLAKKNVASENAGAAAIAGGTGNVVKGGATELKHENKLIFKNFLEGNAEQLKQLKEQRALEAKRAAAAKRRAEADKAAARQSALLAASNQRKYEIAQAKIDNMTAPTAEQISEAQADMYNVTTIKDIGKNYTTRTGESPHYYNIMLGRDPALKQNGQKNLDDRIESATNYVNAWNKNKSNSYKMNLDEAIWFATQTWKAPKTNTPHGSNVSGS